MKIDLQYYSKDSKLEKFSMDYQPEKGLTLSELIKDLSKENENFHVSPNGYVMDRFLYMDGTRLLRPQDDISKCRKIEIIPFVDGG